MCTTMMYIWWLSRVINSFDSVLAVTRYRPQLHWFHWRSNEAPKHCQRWKEKNLFERTDFLSRVLVFKATWVLVVVKKSSSAAKHRCLLLLSIQIGLGSHPNIQDHNCTATACYDFCTTVSSLKLLSKKTST